MTGTRDTRDFTCCENDSRMAQAGRIGMWLCRWFPIAFVYGLAVVVIYFFGVSLCSKTHLRQAHSSSFS